MMLKIILALLATPATYAAFGFVLWESNPAAWSEDARFFLVMASCICVVGMLTCPFLPSLNGKEVGRG